MAIFRPSAIVGAISGDLGGSNFANGPGGSYVRQRRAIVKPKTSKQFQTRAHLQWLRHRWNELTEPQRTAWHQAAANRPIANRLGVTSPISGPAFFIQWNMTAFFTGPLFVAFFSALPPTDPAPDNMPFISFVVTAGGSKILKTTIPAGNPSYFQGYYGARTFSTASRRSWFDFKLVVTNIFTAPSGTQTLDLTATWDELIGDPQVGEQCWIQYLIREGTSFWSTRFRASTFAV